MNAKVFIDGEHGTTGLQIRERLGKRSDIELLSLSHEDRRNADKRKDMLAQCDIAILCLPDDGAREAVSMVESNNFGCRLIDTSTAHRTADDWAFGFAELSPDQPSIIKNAARVSNPGCFSTGAVALLKPMIDAGIVPNDAAVTINAVSGYTGGGKQLIAQMEDKDHPGHIDTSFHIYGLGLEHKHVPEIIVRSGLSTRPLFVPSVGRFPQGMLVSIPLHLSTLNSASVSGIRECLASHYEGCEFVKLASIDECASAVLIKPEDYADRDDMKLWVLGSDEFGHVNLVAQLDNLGKGASGAAVQNLNLMLG